MLLTFKEANIIPLFENFSSVSYVRQLQIYLKSFQKLQATIKILNLIFSEN